MEAVVEKKCPVCGKIYCPAPLHVYKANKRMVCSYSCVRKYEREKENEKIRCKNEKIRSKGKA